MAYTDKLKFRSIKKCDTFSVMFQVMLTEYTGKKNNNA